MSDRDREIVDLYFRNALTEQADVEYFNARMEDVDFKQMVEEETAIIEALGNHDAAQMKKRLQKLESNISKKPNIRIIVAVLLLAALLAFLVQFLLSEHTTPLQSEEVYAQFYTTYPNIIDPLTKGASDAPSIFQLFEQRDFQLVIDAWSEKENRTDAESFYLAMAYLEIGKYVLAEPILGSIQEGQFMDDAAWYGVLVCIRLERGDCLQRLEAIAEAEGSVYGGKALDIMNFISN
ncbi:MAG: hypothetical protein AAGA77_07460 [Bacteroidota bacterium]